MRNIKFVGAAITFATFMCHCDGSGASGDFAGLELTAEGAFHPAELSDGYWTNSSCSVGGYRDFYVDTEHDHAHDNLFIEAIALPSAGAKKEVRLDSLALMVFFGEIPSERTTELVHESSPDSVYSILINANEMKSGRWFVSVRCGDDVDVDFGVWPSSKVRLSLLMG